MANFGRLYARAVFWPTLAWNYMLGRVFYVRRWWDPVDPQVLVGARPFRRDVRRLQSEGVLAVVNTCEEYGGPVREYDGAGIEQLHIPTTDFAHPQIEDIELGVEFVQQHVQRGHRVYIHCKAGRARSATVALCWLVKYRELTPEQAQRRMLLARPHINPRIYQRPVVHEFCRRLEQIRAEADADADCGSGYRCPK